MVYRAMIIITYFQYLKSKPKSLLMTSNRQLYLFFYLSAISVLIYISLSIGETLMTKDDDVEAQKASVVPRNQIADFTNVEKDPLIWEIAGITSHYDPEIRKSAAEILGNAIVS